MGFSSCACFIVSPTGLFVLVLCLLNDVFYNDTLICREKIVERCDGQYFQQVFMQTFGKETNMISSTHQTASA